MAVATVITDRAGRQAIGRAGVRVGGATLPPRRLPVQPPRARNSDVSIPA